MKTPNRDELITLYLEGARTFFPNLNTSSIFSMFSGELEYASSGKIEFNDKIFDVSFSENKPYEIIHYTSLNAFLEIINSQSIRMYNCNNLNDPKEIEHGFKSMNFDFDDESIRKTKSNHFILSTSQFDKEEKDDFNMWRLYGQNGMGVGLVFEVPKEINNWKNITINEIEYTSKSRKSKTKEFIAFHQEFQKTNNLFENIPSIIPLIASFHKDEIWSMENETRIVAHCPFNEYSLEAENFYYKNSAQFLPQSLQHSINSYGTPVTYVQMPISRKIIEEKIKPEWQQEISDNLLSYHPYLQLKRVVIGPQLVHSSSFGPLIHFMDIALKKTGVGLELIKSKYSDLYKK